MCFAICSQDINPFESIADTFLKNPKHESIGLECHSCTFCHLGSSSPTCFSGSFRAYLLISICLLWVCHSQYPTPHCSSLGLLCEIWESPSYCGSIAWVSSCKSRGHWFDSQLGHMSEMVAGLVHGAHMRVNWLVFLFHIDVFVSFSLPSSLSKSKKSNNKL